VSHSGGEIPFNNIPEKHMLLIKVVCYHYTGTQVFVSHFEET